MTKHGVENRKIEKKGDHQQSSAYRSASIRFYCLKVIALIVCIIFSVTTVCLSAPNVYTINIPEEKGKVIQRYKGDSKKVVVHIQDAHQNSEAQFNLAKIICHLIPQINNIDYTDGQEKSVKFVGQNFLDESAKQNLRNQTAGMPFIGIEGAIGEYDLKELRDYPVQDAKEIVGREFVKEGKFIGAELASIIAEEDFTLYGLEDKELFLKDFKAFYQVSLKQSELEHQIEILEGQLALLKDKLYNHELKAFDKNASQYETNQAFLLEYLGTLYENIDDLGIDLLDYIYLLQFKEAFLMEQTIDFESLGKEIEQLAAILIKTEGNDSNEQILLYYQDYKDNKITQREIVIVLSGMAAKQGTPLQDYYNIQRALQYWHKYAMVDMAKMLNEVLDVNNEMRHLLANNNEEKTLIDLWRRMTYLKQLLALKAVKEDVERFRKEKEKYSLDHIKKQMSNLASQVGVVFPQAKLENSTIQFDEILNLVDEFYRLADARDSAMLNNLMSEMDKRGQDVGVLVAGGYHSAGLTLMMKEKNISYLTITPQINNMVADVAYMDRMMGNIAPFDPMMTSHFQMSRINAAIQALVKIGIVNENTMAEIMKEFLTEFQGQTLLNLDGTVRSRAAIDVLIQEIKRKGHERYATALTQIADEIFTENVEDNLIQNLIKTEGGAEELGTKFRQLLGEKVQDEEQLQEYFDAMENIFVSFFEEKVRLRSADKKTGKVIRLVSNQTRELEEAVFTQKRCQSWEKDAVRYLRKEGDAWVCFFDIKKLGDRNKVYGHDIVDIIGIDVVNEAVKKVAQGMNIEGLSIDKGVKGLALHISGDEIVALLPPRLTSQEVTHVLHSVQNQIEEIIKEKYRFVRLKNVNETNKNEVLKVLESKNIGFKKGVMLPVTTQTRSGKEEYEEELFILFTRQQKGSVLNEIQDILSVITENVDTIETVEGIAGFNITIPWAPVGAVKVSDVIPKDMALSKTSINESEIISTQVDFLRKAVAEAEFTQSITKENDSLVRVGLSQRATRTASTEDGLAGIDGLKKQADEIKNSMVNSHNLSDYALEAIYPCIQWPKNVELYEILEKIKTNKAAPFINIIRGPPDRFFIAFKKHDKIIQLLEVPSYYAVSVDDPNIEAFKAATGSRGYRISDENGGELRFGFKIVNDTLSHEIGNDVILALNVALYESLKGTIEEEEPLTAQQIQEVLLDAERFVNLYVKKLGFEIRLNAAGVNDDDVDGDIQHMTKIVSNLSRVRELILEPVKMYHDIKNDDLKKKQFQQEIRKQAFFERERSKDVLLNTEIFVSLNREIDSLTGDMPQLGSAIKDIIAEQHQKAQKLSLLGPDVPHIERAIGNAKKLIKNKDIMQAMKKVFYTNEAGTEKIALMAVLLSKIGFAQVDLSDPTTYKKNRIYALEILDTRLKDDLQRLLNFTPEHPERYDAFKEAILREGGFGEGTESEYTNFRETMINAGVSIERMQENKYKNPLTVLLTIASELDVSQKRLKNWQRPEAVMKALSEVASDPEITMLYAERTSLEIKIRELKMQIADVQREASEKRMAVEEMYQQIARLERDIEANREAFNAALQKITSEKVKEDKFKVLLVLELEACKRFTRDEIEDIYENITKNLLSIDSEAYRWYISAFGIKDIQIDDNGQIVIISNLDQSPSFGAAANLMEIRKFHHKRLRTILDDINLSLETNIKLNEEDVRVNEEAYAVLKDVFKSETHAHLKMSCDFDLYIWNGIILEHGPETQDYRDIVQGSEKLLKKLRKQYGLPEKEIRLEELFSYARETSRALYNFINTYCTDEYIWPTNKNYLVDDAQMLLGIRLALVDADGDITKLTEGQRAFYENYIDKNKMKDLMTVSVEQRDIIRRQIDLYMRLKFGISDMFNFKEGALTEFVTHFMAASKLHKISREDELKTLKRITKEVLRKYQENKNRYVETRFNITADSKKPFDENKQATLHEILAVIQAHKDYKIEQEQRGLGNMVPELKITLSITKFGDNEEPFGKREAHKIESAQIFVDILEEAWKLDDGHYMPITNKEGNEVLNFSTRGSEVTGQNVLQYVIGIDAAGQEEYNPPSLFYKAYQIVMAYKQKVKEMGRDGDLCIGTTSHVSESVTDVTMESGIRFALEALFMKSFEDVDDKTPIVLDRLGHAIVIAVEYDQLFGTERREHVEERLKQIAFDLNLLREGKVPLISITEAQLIQERDMLNNSLRSGALTLQSEIFLGTYTEEMIIDLYARAGYVRDILIEKGTYVETNPTSNVGISPYVSGYKDHPLAVYLKKTYGEWAEDVRQRIVELDAGKYASAIDTAQKYYNTALASDYQGQKVKVTISTDDLTLFGTTPTEELYRMATALDLSFDELFTIIEDGFKSRLGNRPFQYEQEVTEQLQQLRKSFAEKKEAAAIARKSEAMASMQPKGEFYSKQLIRKNKPADGHIVNSLSSQMTQRLTTLPVAATYYRSDARIGLSRFQIDALIKEALVRIQTDKATMPNILFIDFLDKSPEMVVDKFEDGYVGINSALNTIKNQTARAILLDVLVVRGLSRGLMGSDITDTYEREQLKRDVDFAVELLRSACKDNIIEMQRILNEIHQALSEIVEGATFIDALRIAVDTQIRSMQQEAKQADVIPFPSTKEKSLFGDLQEANITVDADEARAIINDMIEGGKLRAGEDEKALRVRDLNVQEELEVTVQENGVGTIARLIQFMMSPFGSRAKTWANRNIPPEKQEAMKIALAQTYMSNVIPLFREKIKGVLHDCGLSEREVVDAISLTKKVEIIYQKMILRDTNYHNHAHNLITVYGALNLAKERLRKTGMKPGESNYKQYMKATFMAGLMHDFHIRSKHMKSETLDRPAYVAETLRQIADLFGIKKYDYTGEEKYYDAHYTDPAFDQDKNTIKSLIKSFLGEKETKDLFPLVRTMILRTDFASDIPVPPTHKPATTKIRDEIDTMIEEQLRGTGRVDVQKVRMHVRRRYRSLITEAGRSGDQAAVNGLRRLRDIEINYARSFADLNISDHTIAHALAYRLEAADQSGFYMYLPSRMVDIAVVSGLASEVANISSWGSFAGFFKPELLTPGFLSILKEAPQDAKENLMNVITYFARNSAESAPLEFLPDGFREAVASSAQTWAEMQDGTREALGLVSPRQLQQTDLQTYFTQAEITDFASHATADTYDLETILPARVRSTNNLYVVLTGTVTTMFDGKTQYFRSGNIVGDIGVFQNLPPNATVSIASGSTIAIIPNVDPAFFRTAQPPIAAGGIRFLKTQPEEVVERATILPAMLKEYKEQFETLREVSIGSTHRHLDVYLKPFSEVIKQEGNKENPDESNLIMVLEDVRADGERSIAFGEDTYMEELLRGLGIRPVFTSNREEIATLKENGYFYVGTDSKSAVAQGAKAKVFLPVDKDKKILRQLAIVHFGLVIMALLAAPSINVDIVDLEEIFDNWTEIAEKNLTGMLDKITTAIRMHAFKVAA